MYKKAVLTLKFPFVDISKVNEVVLVCNMNITTFIRVSN